MVEVRSGGSRVSHGGPQVPAAIAVTAAWLALTAAGLAGRAVAADTPPSPADRELLADRGRSSARRALRLRSGKCHLTSVLPAIVEPLTEPCGSPIQDPTLTRRRAWTWRLI